MLHVWYRRQENMDEAYNLREALIKSNLNMIAAEVLDNQLVSTRKRSEHRVLPQQPFGAIKRKLEQRKAPEYRLGSTRGKSIHNELSELP